ncbi:hypothetical protein H5410_001052 [Solanum commersonii]|uniref:Uncharacterized protein n=1 Tax=Solanum commersonii TaxID=4109 RepID=A0A9J6AZ27_SOLCO|nr:hypothetical protein H5410_001052 [Solanum commersonii]
MNVVIRRFMVVSLAEGCEMSVKGVWGRSELDGRGDERTKAQSRKIKGNSRQLMYYFLGKGGNILGFNSNRPIV